jgi:hypothetical protein
MAARRGGRLIRGMLWRGSTLQPHCSELLLAFTSRTSRAENARFNDIKLFPFGQMAIRCSDVDAQLTSRGNAYCNTRLAETMILSRWCMHFIITSL